MSNRVWRGDAVAVAQVVQITPGLITAGRDYTLRINSKDVTVTATGTTASSLCDLFVTAIGAAGIPEWSEVTPTNVGGVLKLTSRSKGVPFQVSALVAGFAQGAAVEVTIWHTPTGGTWLFDAGDYGDETITYNASASTVQGHMDTLFGSGNTTVSKVSVTATQAVPAHVVYTIEFIGAMAGEPAPEITVDGDNLTGGDAALSVTVHQAAVVGTSEVQTITFYGSATGGTFRFRFRGAYVDLAYNVSTASMQTSIRALSTINGANVDVTGTAGTSYVCTFKNALAHQALEPIEIDTANLTGGTIYADIAVTTPGVTGLNEVQYITQECTNAINEIIVIERSGTVTGGTFKLTYASGGGGQETVDLDWDAPLYEILEAMEDMVAAVTNRGPFFAAAAGFDANESIDNSYGALGIVLVNNAGGANMLDGSGLLNHAIGIDATSLTGGGTYVCPGSGSSNGNANGQTRANDGQFYLRLDYSSNYTSLLTLTIGSLGDVTSPTPAQVQAALEALPEVGAGNVLVTALPATTGTAPSRGLWRVEFVNNLAGTSMPLIRGITNPPITTGSVWNPVGYRARGGVAGTTEVQTLTVHGSPSTGTLALGFDGVTTGPIAHNATALAVEAGLVATPQFNNGDIAATGGPLGSAAVPLTFGGQYTYTDVPTITVDDNLLKVQVVKTTPGVTGKNEIQRLSLADQDVRDGTVTITIEGDTVGALDWDADLATIITELETSSGLTAGDLSESYGGPWPEEDVFVVFGGTMAETDADLITATDSLTNAYTEYESFDPLIVETTTKATGPNHWSDPVNWYNPDSPTENRVPERGDAVFLASGKIDILYGLTQRSTFTVDTVNDWIVPTVRNHDLQDGQIVEVWTTNALPAGLSANTNYYIRDYDSATGKFKLATTATGDAVNITGSGTGTHQVGVRLDKLLQLSTYTGKVGLPTLNRAGYYEYRELDLTIGIKPSGTMTVTIGQGDGNGTPLFNIDTGTDELTFEILNSAGSSEQGRPAVNWLGNNADVYVRVLGGDLGIALRPTETATFDTLEQRGGSVGLGIVTFTTLDKTGGTLLPVLQATVSGVQKIRG